MQHTFHQCCLLTARRWKSECPLCRSALSPLFQQMQWVQTALAPTREEIAQTANRVRNAMRWGAFASLILSRTIINLNVFVDFVVNLHLL